MNLSLPRFFPPISAPGFRFRSRNDLLYLKRARGGERSAPKLTAVDIKTLLSTDEEIKVDQDAAILGLAPNIRLIKHQPSSL